MKYIRMFYVIILMLFFSCSDEIFEQSTLDVGEFTIDVPSGWILEEVQGYDSFVRQIIINENEKIGVDLGWYSSNLNVDNATHNIVFKKIDNKEAKIVEPKFFQSGTTGVFFESIDIEKTKLQISGNDLSEGNQQLLLTAIETIKFK